MRRSTLLILMIAAVAASPVALADAGISAKVTGSCQGCHGAGGDSPSGSVPRLNGQQAGYIATRLHDFLDPTREDPHATKTMWGVVTKLDSATFPEIAAYFASQTPTPRGGGASRALEGKRLFAHGAPGIPVCQSCHGAGGEGNGSVPRLAGQHREYLTNQLQRLQLGLRFSDVMHPTLKAMSDAQAAAIVAYLGKD